MKQSTASLLFLFCLLTAPMLAQPTIGGGTCNSASLSGVYAVSITGRQVTTNPPAAGIYAGVFQANGTAGFDGLNKVIISLAANTNQAVGTQLTWSGTYSVQANCAGVMNITAGGSATLRLALYDGGTDFQVSGSDANFTYSGSGNTQPTTACSAGTFLGVYTFTGTGFALTSGAVSGAENGTGLLQFDGVSKVTVNVTMSAGGAAPSALVLTGSYSMSANCLGSATLTDASANAYVMSFSVYNNTTVSTTAFYTTLAQSPQFLVAGSSHVVYGQPAASAMRRRSGNILEAGTAAKPSSGLTDGRKRA